MRIRTNPLTGRIQPAVMLAAATEGSGGGGGGGAATAKPPAAATPPPPPMGTAFTALSKSLKGGAAAPAAGEEKPPGEEPPPAPETPPKPKEPAPKPPAQPEKKPAAKGAAASLPAEVFTETPPAQPKATPAPPEEPNREELTKGMSDSARKNFARMEEIYNGKLAKLQADLDEAKKNPVTPAEIEEAKTLKADYERIKGEHAEMLKTVEIIGMERSPQFQAKYVAGRAKLIADAAKKVLNAGGSDEKFRAALELNGRAKYDAIDEALNDAPGFIANQVAALVTQIETLDEEKAQALADAKGKLGEWGEEETARQREQNEKLAKAREARFSELVPELAKECIFLRRVPDESEGAAEWNAVVDEITTQGKEFLFTASNFDDFAGAAVKAKAYDRLQKIFLAVRDENLAYAKQIAELTGAEPGSAGANGAGGGGNSGGGNEPAEPLSFAERVKRGLDASKGGG